MHCHTQWSVGTVVLAAPKVLHISVAEGSLSPPFVYYCSVDKDVAKTWILDVNASLCSSGPGSARSVTRLSLSDPGADTGEDGSTLHDQEWSGHPISWLIYGLGVLSPLVVGGMGVLSSSSEAANEIGDGCCITSWTGKVLELN